MFITCWNVGMNFFKCQGLMIIIITFSSQAHAILSFSVCAWEQASGPVEYKCICTSINPCQPIPSTSNAKQWLMQYTVAALTRPYCRRTLIVNVHKLWTGSFFLFHHSNEYSLQWITIHFTARFMKNSHSKGLICQTKCRLLCFPVLIVHYLEFFPNKLILFNHFYTKAK